MTDDDRKAIAEFRERFGRMLDKRRTKFSAADLRILDRLIAGQFPSDEVIDNLPKSDRTPARVAVNYFRSLHGKDAGT